MIWAGVILSASATLVLAKLSRASPCERDADWSTLTVPNRAGMAKTKIPGKQPSQAKSTQVAMGRSSDQDRLDQYEAVSEDLVLLPQGSPSRYCWVRRGAQAVHAEVHQSNQANAKRRRDASYTAFQTTSTRRWQILLEGSAGRKKLGTCITQTASGTFLLPACHRPEQAEVEPR